jgi:prepilin-type N-terminal cleavage/methylation domain-containing protein
MINPVKQAPAGIDRPGAANPQHARSGSASGFSLVEILVVLTIMALLVGLVSNAAWNYLDKGEVTTCQHNLRQIAQNLELYKQRKGKWPKEQGIRFLLVLTKGGKHAMVNGKDTQIFICPGTDDDNRAAGSSEWGSAYDDFDNLDSFTISYAGRNAVDFKIRNDDDVLAADDNEERKNHRYATNFVTRNYNVDKVDIDQFLDEYPDLEWLPVGPDSPFEPFQCLQID